MEQKPATGLTCSIECTPDGLNERKLEKEKDSSGKERKEKDEKPVSKRVKAKPVILAEEEEESVPSEEIPEDTHEEPNEDHDDDEKQLSKIKPSITAVIDDDEIVGEPVLKKVLTKKAPPKKVAPKGKLEE